MDHKEHMLGMAREITAMNMDAIFEKSEKAVTIAVNNGALEAVKEDITEAHGVTLQDEVLYHALVCGFSLALVMAQKNAERFIENGGELS